MKTVSADPALTHPEKELLSILLQDACAGHVPLALWREPGSVSKHLILSENHRQLKPDEPLEDLESGFLLAPFDRERARHFLPADLIFTFEGGRLKSAATPREEASAQWLYRKLESNPPATRLTFPDTGTVADAGRRDMDSFTRLIQDCIGEIQRGSFEKIVPSRTKHIALPENFDVVHSFQKLCENYPEALITFVSIPGVGSWLGATPELLVSVEDKTIFKTVALAGTLPYEPGQNIKSVAWTQKEIEEQALVERYVISCFKKIRLREYDEYGPKTVVAGNLLHLKSEFTVDLRATNFPQLGSVMLGLLHPTSAVCGMPLEPALNFLKEHEHYDRGFYAGYLGPVNIHQRTGLFVNLRCMQLSGGKGILYAGAGVTIDSIPEKEWAETEIKFNTLLNVIL